MLRFRRTSHLGPAPDTRVHNQRNMPAPIEPAPFNALVTYSVRVFGPIRDRRVRLLRQAIDFELARLGLAGSVGVTVAKTPPKDETPSVGVLFGSPGARTDLNLDSSIRSATKSGLVVVPVVEDLHRFSDQVPPSASLRNGVEWSGRDPAAHVAAVLLAELGVEESKRRVFISHRRSDALQVAEQLHDALTHKSFDPFIDRFNIRPGAVVQDEIIEAIEDFAFLLLLESPDAHSSDWVIEEVDYALSHSMGLLIVSWPEATPLPGTVGLPRLKLAADEVSADGTGIAFKFTNGTVDRILDAVELGHAEALARRRRMLINSVQDSVLQAGGECTPLVHWRLAVTVGGTRSIVAVCPRPPDAKDLEALDAVRLVADPSAQALLVHGARALGSVREQHLKWVIGARSMQLIADSDVGGYW
jgi:hypothetical protein